MVCGRSVSTFLSNLQKNDRLVLKLKVSVSFKALIPYVWTKLHGVTPQLAIIIALDLFCYSKCFRIENLGVE
jgi:hypothetical protein